MEKDEIMEAQTAKVEEVSLFDKFVSKEIPVDFIYEDDQVSLEAQIID